MASSLVIGFGEDTFGDDTPLYFGSDDDYWFTYDSADSEFQLWTTDGDGSGTDERVFRVDDGENALTVVDDLHAKDGEVIWDASVGEVPDSALGVIDNATLANDSVTVAGNAVALGASTAVSIDDLSDVASTTEAAGQLPIWNATAGEYQNASLTGGTEIAITQADASITIDLDTPIDNADLSNDSVTIAGNAVSLGGSTTVAHADLSNITSDQHHNQTHNNTDHSTKMVEDATGDAHVPHEIQIDGTDGNGIINFKTT